MMRMPGWNTDPTIGRQGEVGNGRNGLQRTEEDYGAPRRENGKDENGNTWPAMSASLATANQNLELSMSHLLDHKDFRSRLKLLLVAP